MSDDSAKKIELAVKSTSRLGPPDFECPDSAAAYAEELELRITELVAKAQHFEDTLERLACLGNGDLYGNSEGNVIAQQALAKYRTQENSHE